MLGVSRLPYCTGVRNFPTAIQKITQAIRLQPQDDILRNELERITAAHNAYKQRSEGALRGAFNRY